MRQYVVRVNRLGNENGMFVRSWMMVGEGRMATDMQWLVVMRDTVRSKDGGLLCSTPRKISHIG